MNIGRFPLRQRGVWRHFCAAFLLCAAAAIGSSAQTFTSLFSFDGRHGGFPATPLIQGLDGAMYGTTQGLIFRITPEGKALVVNSSLAGPSALVLANDGNFYGTTMDYATVTCGTVGQQSCGSVFRLTPQGTLTTLFTFNSPSQGAGPSALVQGADGNFYGTTLYGGAVACSPWVGCGTVFKITPAGKLTTLYNFCSQTACADGGYPTGLVQGSDGSFYGTAQPVAGRAITYGTVFKITAAGKLTTLHTFCSLPNCQDGYGPTGPLVQGSDGNFYGTTLSGGGGVVFKITPTGTLTTLYTFCSKPGCTDGRYPNGGLIQATDGNFYGTTSAGGDQSIANCTYQGCGTIFEITPTGAFSTLHTFVSTDGQNPYAGLLQRTDGTFYGTTNAGGSNGCNRGCGTVFSLSTGLGPFVKLTRDWGKAGQVGGILGQGFTGTTGVFLNGTPASFMGISDTHILATVPTGATSGFITVTTPSGTLTSNVVFRVTP